jgi:superfamily I DNA and/or RNA helicase
LIRNKPILCTTLSMAGSKKLEIIDNEVDYLIVDEAC